MAGEGWGGGLEAFVSTGMEQMRILSRDKGPTEKDEKKPSAKDLREKLFRAAANAVIMGFLRCVHLHMDGRGHGLNDLAKLAKQATSMIDRNEMG